MSATIKLETILEGMDMQYEGTTAWVDTGTGNVFIMESSYIRDAEDGESYEHLPEEEQEKMALVRDMLEDDEKYIELPTSFDIHEYEMIEDFCFSVQDKQKRTTLLREIRGKGAFRRFKDNVESMDLEQAWYTFRDNCYKQLAIDFCEQHNLEYTK